MLSDFVIRSTAAIGGTPFRFNKCTALSSAGSGAAIGGATAGVPSHDMVVLLVLLVHYLVVFLEIIIPIRLVK